MEAESERFSESEATGSFMNAGVAPEAALTLLPLPIEVALPSCDEDHSR